MVFRVTVTPHPQEQWALGFEPRSPNYQLDVHPIQAFINGYGRTRTYIAIKAPGLQPGSTSCVPSQPWLVTKLYKSLWFNQSRVQQLDVDLYSIHYAFSRYRAEPYCSSDSRFHLVSLEGLFSYHRLDVVVLAVLRGVSRTFSTDARCRNRTYLTPVNSRKQSPDMLT